MNYYFLSGNIQKKKNVAEISDISRNNFFISKVLKLKIVYFANYVLHKILVNSDPYINSFREIPKIDFFYLLFKNENLFKTSYIHF